MNKRRLISGLGLAAALMVGGHLISSAPVAASPDTPWESVRQAYQQARDRAQAEDVDHALSLADGYLAAHPRDGRALTYRGSLAALRARVSWMPWKKLGMLHEGIGQMDDGVSLVTKAAPGSAQELEVRLVRGITSANIPSTFGRGGVAFSDFKAVVKHPHFPELAAEHRATALAWMAVMHKRQGQVAESERLQREAEALDATAARKVSEQAA
jgi:hypothetical protein